MLCKATPEKLFTIRNIVSAPRDRLNKKFSATQLLAQIHNIHFVKTGTVVSVREEEEECIYVI